MTGATSEVEWDMRLFETEEIFSYLANRLHVQKSVYDAIVYDSEVEKAFAQRQEKNEAIRLFVKLPSWFVVETPIGKYNPDWAILKHDEEVLYLVRETKATKNFEKLRAVEAEKVMFGRKHFQELGVDFAVVPSGSEL